MRKRFCLKSKTKASKTKFSKPFQSKNDMVNILIWWKETLTNKMFSWLSKVINNRKSRTQPINANSLLWARNLPWTKTRLVICCNWMSWFTSWMRKYGKKVLKSFPSQLNPIRLFFRTSKSLWWLNKTQSMSCLCRSEI